MVDFRDDVELDTSQVDDQRGRRGRGGMAAGGLGGLGIVGVIVYLLMQVLGGGGGGLPANPLDQLNNTQQGGGAPTSDVANECRTGADADRRQDCRILAFTNSIQAYWKKAYAEAGERYPQARTVYFSGQVNTRCGAASSAVGPFYCPLDQRVYIDLGFFQQLEQQFGAKGGPFAEAYVIAHEYGHHVQNVEGILEKAQQDRRTGPQSAAVRVELQADCLAGVWARNATATGFFEKPLSDQEIQEALDAASAVGDDRIQDKMQGRVTPESWTHGSSAQRMQWFTRGYQSGNPNQCNTFAVPQV